MAKKSFYAVSKGRKPGIYTSWDAAKAQVTGFSGAAHKGFKNEMEAMQWLQEQDAHWSEQLGGAAPMLPPASVSGRLPANEIEALIEQDQQHLEEEALYAQQQQQHAVHHYCNQQSEATAAFPERQQQRQQQQEQQQQRQQQPASIGRRMRMVGFRRLTCSRCR